MTDDEWTRRDREMSLRERETQLHRSAPMSIGQGIAWAGFCFGGGIAVAAACIGEALAR